MEKINPRLVIPASIQVDKDKSGDKSFMALVGRSGRMVVGNPLRICGITDHTCRVVVRVPKGWCLGL